MLYSNKQTNKPTKQTNLILVNLKFNFKTEKRPRNVKEVDEHTLQF